MADEIVGAERKKIVSHGEFSTRNYGLFMSTRQSSPLFLSPTGLRAALGPPVVRPFNPSLHPSMMTTTTTLPRFDWVPAALSRSRLDP